MLVRSFIAAVGNSVINLQGAVAGSGILAHYFFKTGRTFQEGK